MLLQMADLIIRKNSFGGAFSLKEWVSSLVIELEFFI